MMYFDSLTHPTLDGLWLNGKAGETFADVSRSLREAGCGGACAVGLPGVGSYQHAAFFAAASEHPTLFPVAALTDVENCERDLERIARVGFRAVKVHPRLLGTHPTDRFLSRVFKASTDHKLIVFLCTYYHNKVPLMVDEDPYWHLVRALNRNQDTKVVLVHGGGVRVMEYAELCRFSSGLLLDLSLTIRKYDGSSLTNDIAFLLRHFDRRICIGSDSPEYRIPEIWRMAEHMTTDVAPEKRANAFFKNIRTFLGIE